MIQARQVNELIAIVRVVTIMNSLFDVGWQPWLLFDTDVFVKLPSISDPLFSSSVAKLLVGKSTH